jgi:hypothetical protein
MDASFLPPCDGDWPTISPHPTAEGLVLHHFYSLQGVCAGNRLGYKRLPRNRFSSHPLASCRHLPTVAVYSQHRTVPSLMRAALLVAVSQGYLAPSAQLGHLVPHRIVDGTYHYLWIAEMFGTVIH